MNHLILYAHVTEDIFIMMPEQLHALQHEHLRVFDFDTRSGKEVIQTALTAMEQANSIILVLDISSEKEDCSSLFPVMKRAVKYKDRTELIQLGNHNQLGFIQKYLSPVIVQNREMLFRYLNEGSKR